jgi:hypothetical protein
LSFVDSKFPFAQLIWIPQVLIERFMVGNSLLHLLRAHTQSVPWLTQTGNMLGKFALYFFDLLFERLHSLACFGRELLSRLQRQPAQLSVPQDRYRQVGLGSLRISI